MSPRISVILPFFNAGKTLEAAIQSIIDQTFFEFELILVDNNSTDNSCLIAESFKDVDERVIIVSEKNQGVANAMNKGLEKARGEFVARMDADDIAMARRLEKQFNFLVENPDIGLVGSDVKYIPHFKNTAGFQKFVKWVNSFHSSQEISIKRFREIPVVNPTIFFRKNLIDQFGGCRNGNFPEDYEMLLRFMDFGVKMYKIPEELIEWHDYKSRLTRTDNRYSFEAFFKIKAYYFNKWSEENNPFHPNIWVWGAGRKSRQRCRYLEDEGLIITGYFDIDENKTDTKQCFHFSKLPEKGNIFVVSMVAKHGAYEKIKNYLHSKQYMEGTDFTMMV